MIKKSRVIIFFVMLYMFCSSSFAGPNVTVEENHMVSPGIEEKSANPVLFPVKFFRDYISGADGNRCPMYPTCSQYCIEVFKKHGSFLGWVMCNDRLLRCGRDEKKVSAPVWINGEKRSYDPVNNNDFWWQ